MTGIVLSWAEFLIPATIIVFIVVFWRFLNAIFYKEPDYAAWLEHQQSQEA